MSITLTILGMAIITFLIRYLPYFKADKIAFPPLINKMLTFTPVAVLSAIVVPGVLKAGGDHFVLSGHNVYLIASILALGIALYTKNLLLTIVLGSVIFLSLGAIL